jgi:competence protein ComEC
LLAPHHGSRTSSSAELLATVRPQWVVVQAGYLSRYGHPAPQVLARYRAHGVRWAATPDCGAALWRSTSPQTLVCQRQAQPRHWHWRSAIDPLTPLWGERPGPEPDPSGTLENP